MNEKEVKKELELELQWVQYRQKMLDIIEEKLQEMRKIAEEAKQDDFTTGEFKELNAKLNNLAAQVRALDGESRGTEDRKILE